MNFAGHCPNYVIMYIIAPTVGHTRYEFNFNAGECRNYIVIGPFSNQ